MDYEATDADALYHALLALRTCPNKHGARVCRADLVPVGFCQDTFACPDCNETWHLPPQER